jgi:hypothetical protein
VSRGDLARRALLGEATELLPQLMRRLFQHAVVRHGIERASLPLLLDFDLRQTSQKSDFFLLQGSLLDIHAIAPGLNTVTSPHPLAAV